MIRPTTKTVALLAALTITTVGGVWSVTARGGSTASTIAGVSEEVRCVTITSGSAAADDSQTRVIVGQALTGSVSDGTSVFHAGAAPCLSRYALEPLFADFDRNRVINEYDLFKMTECLGGPELFVTADCEIGIADGDDDVDLQDMAEFQRVYSGNPLQ